MDRFRTTESLPISIGTHSSRHRWMVPTSVLAALCGPPRRPDGLRRRGREVVWSARISDGGEVLHPVILAHGGAIWYAWSECSPGGGASWPAAIGTASGARYSPSPPARPCSSPACSPGGQATSSDGAAQGQRGRRAVPLTEAGPGAAETVSAVGEATGPARPRRRRQTSSRPTTASSTSSLPGRAPPRAGRDCGQPGRGQASTWIAADSAVVGWYDYGYGRLLTVAPPTSAVRDAQPRSIPVPQGRGLVVSTWPPTPRPSGHGPPQQVRRAGAPAGATSPGAVGADVLATATAASIPSCWWMRTTPSI